MYAASWTTAPPVRPAQRTAAVERAGGRTDRARVRRVVEVERRRVGRLVQVGGPAGVGPERDGLELRARERRPGGIVGIERVGQQDPLPFVGQRQRELAERRLRARDDRDLALGIELDAVHVAVARRERLLRAGEAPDRGVAVHVGAGSALRQRLDDVRRRPDLGIAAAEVDERRPIRRGCGGDTTEKRDEVLLRQPIQAFGSGAHLVGL